MATSEGIPSSIDIEFLELNDNPYIKETIPSTPFASATRQGWGRLAQDVWELLG